MTETPLFASMIALSRKAYDDVVRHAYEGGEAEVCGVLAGTRGEADEPAVVSDARRAENVAGRPQIRYRIDPEEQLELIEAIEGDGLEVVGFYHSPGWPAPPERDRRGAGDLARPLVRDLRARRLPVRGVLAVAGRRGWIRTGDRLGAVRAVTPPGERPLAGSAQRSKRSESPTATPWRSVHS